MSSSAELAAYNSLSKLLMSEEMGVSRAIRILDEINSKSKQTRYTISRALGDLTIDLIKYVGSYGALTSDSLQILERIPFIKYLSIDNPIEFFMAIKQFKPQCFQAFTKTDNEIFVFCFI